MITQHRISGFYSLPNAVVQAGQSVQCRCISDWFFSQNTLIGQEVISAEINTQTGAWELELAVPDDPNVAAKYMFLFPDGQLFEILLSGSSPNEWDELLGYCIPYTYQGSAMKGNSDELAAWSVFKQILNVTDLEARALWSAGYRSISEIAVIDPRVLATVAQRSDVTLKTIEDVTDARRILQLPRHYPANRGRAPLTDETPQYNGEFWRYVENNIEFFYWHDGSTWVRIVPNQSS